LFPPQSFYAFLGKKILVIAVTYGKIKGFGNIFETVVPEFRTDLSVTSLPHLFLLLSHLRVMAPNLAKFIFLFFLDQKSLQGGLRSSNGGVGGILK